MRISHLRLKNWRNFKSVDVNFENRMFIIGPNASGKSNFLDVFRFLRDIAKPSGGGLLKAVKERGGMPKLRCLAARSDPEISIYVKFEDNPKKNSDKPVEWEYSLSFKAESRGKRRILISKEVVKKNNEKIVKRPNSEDIKDNERLTQTFLEQVNANSEFRDIVEYFQSITYLHLVPQLLKNSMSSVNDGSGNDPFGLSFLERIAKTLEKTQKIRLGKIEKALQVAVPQLKELKFVRDKITGKPHLEARYDHWRPNAGWQREDQFSDGTLRLIGILWLLLEKDSLLLLEEPELSLNEEIVRKIPLLISKIQRKNKKRQMLISTHSKAMLEDKSIGLKEVIRLEPSETGSTIESLTEIDEELIKSGWTIADVVSDKIKPNNLEQLSLF